MIDIYSATTVALPARMNRRPLNDLGNHNPLLIHALSLTVKFGPKVPHEQRAKIEGQVRAYQASLDFSDPAASALHAKVFQGYHTEGSTDKTRHATVSYHSGSPSGHNKLGDARHLYEDEDYAMTNRSHVPHPSSGFNINVPQSQINQTESNVQPNRATFLHKYNSVATIHSKVLNDSHGNGIMDNKSPPTARHHSRSPSDQNKSYYTRRLYDERDVYDSAARGRRTSHLVAKSGNITTDNQNANIEARLYVRHASIGLNDPATASSTHAGLRTKASSIDAKPYAKVHYHCTPTTANWVTRIASMKSPDPMQWVIS